MTGIVAIHQPNFFPWLGFFEKILRCDTFVFLNHVQYPKTGGVWCNRVKMLQNGQAQWLTAPIVRSYHGIKAICEMEFDSKQEWRSKLLRVISTNYSKAPYYDECMSVIGPLLLNPENNIALYNSSAVVEISKKLGISESKFQLSSSYPTPCSSNEMLVHLAKSVGCGVYLCGSGAQNYQDENVFSSNGVRLLQQNFQHPAYPQIGTDNFVAGLSIIDAVMNLGWNGTRHLLLDNLLNYAQ